MCEPITAELEGNERITVRDLPGCQMASTIHIGPFEGLSEAYGAFLTWIEQNGYRIVGPNREIYLRNPGDGCDPSEYVTEIQFPVAKS